MQAIMGRKLGMTRIFDPSGKATAVTVIEAEPNIVTQIKNQETDGYDSTQIGFGLVKHVKKPQMGHLGKIKSENLKVKNLRYLREFKNSKNQETLKVGDEIKADIFKLGEKVSVTSTSKGKGFAGNVKRHGFTTGPKTHGSDNYRRPGSIGDTNPARVVKGRRMAGHMGAVRVTTINLEIMDIDTEKNLLIVKGSVPGPNKSLVLVKSLE